MLSMTRFVNADATYLYCGWKTDTLGPTRCERLSCWHLTTRGSHTPVISNPGSMLVSLSQIFFF